MFTKSKVLLVMAVDWPNISPIVKSTTSTLSPFLAILSPFLAAWLTVRWSLKRFRSERW
jgi:hypothetical protein